MRDEYSWCVTVHLFQAGVRIVIIDLIPEGIMDEIGLQCIGHCLTQYLSHEHRPLLREMQAIIEEQLPVLQAVSRDDKMATVALPAVRSSACTRSGNAYSAWPIPSGKHGRTPHTNSISCSIRHLCNIIPSNNQWN